MDNEGAIDGNREKPPFINIPCHLFGKGGRPGVGSEGGSAVMSPLTFSCNVSRRRCRPTPATTTAVYGWVVCAVYTGLRWWLVKLTPCPWFVRSVSLMYIL